MATVAYRPAKGARLSRGDAQRYGERLHALAGRGGELTPRVVRDDAADPNSPLHKYFTWNDTEAAEKWRMEQAKYLLRSIEVVYLDPEGAAKRVRAFHSIPIECDEEDGEGEDEDNEDAPGRVFVTVGRVMREEATRVTLIADLKRRIRGLREDMEAIDGLSEAVRLLRAAEVAVEAA